MPVKRWLPATVVVVVACLVAPDAEAQAWLRWSKVPVSQHDPAKRMTPVRRASPAPEPRRGPTITISEEPPAVMSSATLAARAVEPVAPAVTTPCSDCPTPDELKATGATAPSDGKPQDHEIQSEIKRRLLQGH